MDHAAVACSFDLLMVDGDDLRRKPLSERKAALAKSYAAREAAFSTSNMLRVTAQKCLPLCAI
jgi:ATP-dependent DNA ligase